MRAVQPGPLFPTRLCSVDRLSGPTRSNADDILGFGVSSNHRTAGRFKCEIKGLQHVRHCFGGLRESLGEDSQALLGSVCKLAPISDMPQLSNTWWPRSVGVCCDGDRRRCRTRSRKAVATCATHSREIRGAQRHWPPRPARGACGRRAGHRRNGQRCKALGSHFRRSMNPSTRTAPFGDQLGTTRCARWCTTRAFVHVIHGDGGARRGG